MNFRNGAVPLAVVALCAAACSGGSKASSSSSPSRSPSAPAGLQKIKHVVVIMQENRSFDSYFGTFPGADGIPTTHGQFDVCLPDPAQAESGARFMIQRM